jgi:nitrate reductase molybdenum cofactor assembly chaperone NarJ/NarW
MAAPRREIGLFASLLDYPGPGIRETAREIGPGRLGPFLDLVERSSRPDLESLYAEAFDFEPSTCLYAGYHLFGDTSRRGPFLVGLKALYARAGFAMGAELPDHLPLMLRFLAGGTDFDERRELVGDCLVPVVAALRRRLEVKGHPYAPLFEALQGVLEEEGRS